MNVEVEPVALGRINVEINLKAIFAHVNRAHILCDVPHEAVNAFGIDDLLQECGDPPRS